MKEKIGIVGCGLMGRGIALNYIKKGYKVYLYDINKEAVEHIVLFGGIASPDIKTLASNIDYMILSLPSPELVKQTLLDDGGALASMQEGTYILDMSTNDVELTRNLSKEAESKGVIFFDCPLSGGAEGAKNGTLTIMVGGPNESFATVRPILEVVGQVIEYVGSSGAGQTVKLCHNMVVGGIISLLSEALLTAKEAGVNEEKVAEIMQKGSAQTRVMEVFGANILNKSFGDIKFSLSNMTKDLELYYQLAKDVRVNTNISDSAKQLYHLANEGGRGMSDSTAVYELLQELSEQSSK